jgi:hypothetical protein
MEEGITRIPKENTNIPIDAIWSTLLESTLKSRIYQPREKQCTALSKMTTLSFSAGKLKIDAFE